VLTSYSFLSFTTQENVTSSVSFEIGTTHGQIGCFYTSLPFEAVRADEIFVFYAATGPINFYVMSEPDFNSWKVSRMCAVSRALFRAEGFDKLDSAESIVIPTDRQYEFVFINTEPNKDALVTFQVRAHPTTSIGTYTSLITTTLTNSYVMTLVNSSNYPTQYLAYAIALALLLCLLAASILAYLRRRKSMK
jgi:hypothetical protein